MNVAEIEKIHHQILEHRSYAIPLASCIKLCESEYDKDKSIMSGQIYFPIFTSYGLEVNIAIIVISQQSQTVQLMQIHKVPRTFHCEKI